MMRKGAMIGWLLLGFCSSAVADPQNIPVASDSASEVQAGNSKEISANEHLAGRDLRVAVRDELRRSSKANSSDSADCAHTLLRLYADLQLDNEMSGSERERLRIKVRSRLLKLAHVMERKELDARDEQRLGSTASNETAPHNRVKTVDGTRPSARTGAAGGAGLDDGESLVELIRTTIAPNSWDVNGGAGTIRYWSPWRVLVVRQTSDVHEQIGGVFGVLRN